MNKFRTLVGLTALAFLPIAAQAEMSMMTYDELAAVEGQAGQYSVSAGSIDLFTFNTAMLGGLSVGPIALSGVYGAVNTRAPNLVPTARDRGLTLVNGVILPPVNAAVRTTLIASIPIFGSTVADMVTPIGVTFTP
jgi:hypothetical protein